MPVNQAGEVMQTKVMAEEEESFWKIVLVRTGMRIFPEVMPCERNARVQRQSRAG